jgi:hypothetical protein
LGSGWREDFEMKKDDIEDYKSKDRCHADRAGDCEWKKCPQAKVHEVYCKLAKRDEERVGEDYYGA